MKRFRNLNKVKLVFLILLLFLFGNILFIFENVYAQVADSPWPTYKGNTQHTGLSPYDTSQTKPIEKWRFQTDGGVESSVTIGSDGTLYVGGFQSNFYALTSEGKEKWRFSEPRGWFRSTASVGKDGTIYIGAVIDNKKDPSGKKKFEYGKPIVYALNPDGTKKWEFSAGGSYDGMYISPTVAPDGTIYVVSGGEFEPADAGKGGKLWAINPDGTAKWNFDARKDSSVNPDTICGFGTTAALAKDGTIYVASSCGEKGRLFAITPEGKEKWFFPSERYFDGTPTIGPDGTIYAGSWDRNLYALTPEGKEKWHFTTTAPVECSPSIGPDGTIYTGTLSMHEGKDNHLYALNPDGTLKWKFETGNGVDATPAIGKDGTLYFGSYDGNLYSLNPDGTERWRFKTDGGIVANPSVDKDGTIYFGSWDKNVYAIGGQQLEDNLKTVPTNKGIDQTSDKKFSITYVVVSGFVLALLVGLIAYFKFKNRKV